MNLSKIYDLSQDVYANCPGWPTYQFTRVEYEAYCARDRFMAERIEMNAHTGTHIDAPFHFFPNLKTIDQLSVELFQGDAVIVDLSKRITSAEGITAAHLEPFSHQITERKIVVLFTGWCRKRGYGEDYCKNYPYLTGEGAEWLKARKIRGVCIDTLSLGGWYEGTGRPCHEVLLPEDIWILEEIFVPEELLEKKSFYLCAFPIKLKGFSGAPTRAVGMLFE